MIKVSVMYPNQSGARFDMDYYLNSHIPMVGAKLGSALKGAEVEEGVGGGAPGQPATYLVAAHLRFDSVDAFQSAFGPHANDIMADIPNYTDLQPIIQVSEIRMSQ